MRAIGYHSQGEFLRVDDKTLKDEDHSQRLRAVERRLVEVQNRVKHEFALLPARLDSSHTYTSVAGAGCHSEMGKRQTMEDDEIMVDPFNGNPKMVLARC